MPTSFIADGYTENGFIAAAPDGLYGALKFIFRPALPDETAEMLEQCDKKGGRGGTFIINKFMADKVKEWNLTDKDGRPVPINTNNMNRLKRLQWLRLQNIVTCMAGSDPEEGASEVSEPNPEQDAKNS